MSAVKRLARLTVAHAKIDLTDGEPAAHDWPSYLNLRAGNERILATTEVYANPSSARRARKALLRAFAEVLIREGWIEAEQVKWGGS